MRKAFTLIEMLVVLAIIGLLMGLIAPKLLKAIKTSREATCRMNLKNLHTAVSAHAVDHADETGDDPIMPRAGSFETRHHDKYFERRAWVSWIPKSGKESDWPAWGTLESNKAKMKDAKHYGEEALLAIRKGTLYGYTGKEHGVYSCPVAANDKAFRAAVGATKRTDKMYLTYVMNEFFFHEQRKGAYGRRLSWIGTSESTSADGVNVVPDANRLVLFAEYSGTPWTTDASVIGRNCVLNVTDAFKNTAVTKLSGNTIPGIGGCHDGPIQLRDSDDKVIPWGLVIFADGHIDKQFPNVRDPASAIKNTGWLLTRGRDLPDKTN